jgi:hypothetical protein
MSDEFDALAWNDPLSWWSGTAEVTPGHDIDLHVQAANDASALRAAVAWAKPAWERLRAAEPSVRVALAGQLTDAHNEYCDPEDEVTPEEFAARPRLLSALFESAGTVELCYHDGMLFGGHWLLVPVAADGSIGKAVEAG